MTNDLIKLEKFINDIDLIKNNERLVKDPDFMMWKTGVQLLLKKLDSELSTKFWKRDFDSPPHMRYHSTYQKKQKAYISDLEGAKADLLALLDHLESEKPNIDYSKISWMKVTCYKLKFWKTTFYKKHIKKIMIFFMLTIVAAIIGFFVNDCLKNLFGKPDQPKIEKQQ
ncbi:MAG: hypothetical protein ACTSXQ_02005 [Alphaproteobacteria bacterium]